MMGRGAGSQVSVPWLDFLAGGLPKAKLTGWFWSSKVWLDSSEVKGGSEYLQRRGGKLLHAPLSEEGALDGLELGGGLRVLQGGVGGRHCTLQENGEQSNIK